MTLEWFRIVESPVPVDSRTKEVVLAERYNSSPIGITEPWIGEHESGFTRLDLFALCDIETDYDFPKVLFKGKNYVIFDRYVAVECFERDIPVIGTNRGGKFFRGLD